MVCFPETQKLIFGIYTVKWYIQVLLDVFWNIWNQCLQILVTILVDDEILYLVSLYMPFAFKQWLVSCIATINSHLFFHLSPMWYCRWVTIATLSFVFTCLLTSGTGLCQLHNVTLLNSSACTRRIVCRLLAEPSSLWTLWLAPPLLSPRPVCCSSVCCGLAGGFLSLIGHWHIISVVLWW